jgi:hypothetical protein
MFRPWIIIIVYFIVSCTPISATKYYVSSSTGDDSRDGKSVSTAWKTISKVNGKTYLPGDSILFRCGDVWRETMIIPSSGRSGNYIYFGSYGTGAKPKILGSIQATSWTNQGANVWKSTKSVSNPYVPSDFAAEIFFEHADGTTTWGANKSNTAALASEYDWTWSANYIYVFAPSDPSTRYTSVEVPQRERGIYVNTREYITIDGLELKFAKSRTIEADEVINGNGFTIKNCHLSYVGSRFSFPGTGPLGYHLAVVRNDMLIQNNEIDEGGRRLISIHLYDYSGLTFSDIIIDGNTLYGGYHGNGIGIAMDDGRSNNRFENITIRNNLIYDSPTRNPSVDGFDVTQQVHLAAGEPGASIANVNVYNNLFKYTTNISLELYNVENVTVYNNVFYEFNPNGSPLGYSIQLDISHASTAVDVRNNIFYNTVSYDVLHAQPSVYLEPDQPMKDVFVNYNLFYEADTRVGMIDIAGTYYYKSDWANMKSVTGWQTNEPGIVDPLFVSATDLHLQAASPAIGKGINVTINGVTLDKDRDGNYYNNPPSIGAYEGNPIQNPDTSSKKQIIILYPNPTHGYLVVSREGSVLEALNLNIISMSGKIMYKDFIERGVKNKQFPINLYSGIYLVKIFSGNSTTASQKLIVVNF